MNDREYSCYVLHVRPYTDTRVLVELFDRQQGRITTIFRLSKKQGRATLAPFVAMLPVFSGRHELKTLVSIDARPSKQFNLFGKLSFCGLYINELVMRLLPQAHAHEDLFDAYEQCLAALSAVDNLPDAEPALRIFELKLAEELGYGINFCETVTGEPLREYGFYRFNGEGFVSVNEDEDAHSLSGDVLLQIHAGDFRSQEARLAAKRLVRVFLNQLLDGKPLHSRELFR